MSNRKKYNALLRANAFFPSGDMEDPLNGEIRSMRKRKHKRKIVAASFDYDDCTDAKGFQYFRDGTVTFIRTPITEKLRPPPYGDDLNQTLEALDARFDADTEGADEVVGFVGSKRQSTRNDYFNMAMLDNGLSFPVIEQLCRERDWVFERLLYADVVFKRKPGESMKMVDMERGGISRDSAFREEISTDIKSGFIQEQLDYVSKKYPDDDITFVFYDDDYEETIFRELATNLKLPPNVSAIKLVKCDTHIGSEKVKPVIHDHTHLVRPIPYLKASIVKAIQAYIENAQKQLASLPENVPISAAERSKFHYYPSTFSTPVSKRDHYECGIERAKLLEEMMLDDEMNSLNKIYSAVNRVAGKARVRVEGAKSLYAYVDKAMERCFDEVGGIAAMYRSVVTLDRRPVERSKLNMHSPAM